MRVLRVVAVNAVAALCLIAAPTAAAGVNDCSRGDVRPANPSFDTDAAGWTASLGTTIHRTADGLGLWKRSFGNLLRDDTLNAYLAGTMVAGYSYTATFQARVTPSSSSTAARPIVIASLYGSSGGGSINVRRSVMTSYAIVWTPDVDDCPDFRLRAVGFDNVNVTIDNLAITTCPPYGFKFACVTWPDTP